MSVWLRTDNRGKSTDQIVCEIDDHRPLIEELQPWISHKFTEHLKMLLYSCGKWRGELLIRILGRGESFKKPTKLVLLILSTSSERLNVAARLLGAVSAAPATTRLCGGGGAISQVIDRSRCCYTSSWGRVCRTRWNLGCGVVVATSQGGRPRRSLATARPHGWWWWVESGTLPQVICGQVAQVTHISHSNIFQIFTGNNLFSQICTKITNSVWK